MREIVCFHNPEERNGYLSNWYLSDFELDEIRYTSMEQYMMYQKAVLFDDKHTAQQILKTSDVGKIKALGRAVKGYDDVIWNGLRQVIVYKGLREKFRQNEEIKTILFHDTGGAHTSQYYQSFPQAPHCKWRRCGHQ